MLLLFVLVSGTINHEAILVQRRFYEIVLPLPSMPEFYLHLYVR